MAAIIEVKYFNSFWLKKVEKDANSSPTTTEQSEPVWPGLDWNPFGLPSFPIQASYSGSPGTANNYLSNWYIEEARVKGGFNNKMVSQGVRAYLNEETPVQDLRESSLIYSGIYNSRTDINQTNVFSVGEPITTSLDPANGSIQKLFAEDTNLVIFQENKVSKALIDKDAIYSAEGNNTPVTTQNLVIGQIVPYLGRYGIGKNPESFAQFGFRKYFVDPNRAAVMRLSRDGLTNIAEYGMKDYFRDTLSSFNNLDIQNRVNFTLTNDVISWPSSEFYIENIDLCEVFVGSRVYDDAGEFTGAIITDIVERSSPTVSPPEYVVTVDIPITLNSFSSPVLPSGFFGYTYKNRIVGGWDNYTSAYTLSLQSTPNYVSEDTDYSTLAFDDKINGWTTFYTYKPSFIFSLKGTYYTTTRNKVYNHYVDSPDGNHGVFYDVYYPSFVEMVINNNPSVKKVFQTINYEGDNGWQVVSAITDRTRVNQTNNPISFDSAKVIYSYKEGLYQDSLGYTKRAGFDRKENIYVAPLINQSLTQPEQIIPSELVSGLKGYLLNVTISNDSTTDYKGPKELWSVGTTFVQSS